MEGRIYTLSRTGMGLEGIKLTVESESGASKTKTITGDYRKMRYAVNDFLLENNIKEKRYMSPKIFRRLLIGHPKKITIIYGNDIEMKIGKTGLPKKIDEYFDNL